jgi:nitronate monooxygenase
MGTAFLTCTESGIPDAYREAIMRAREDETRLTLAFSGRPARGIVNRFMNEVEGSGASDAILPFPLQNVLTRPMRKAAAAKGRAEYLSLWSGQAPRLARRQTAAELMQKLTEEIQQTQKRLAQAIGSI